MARKRSRKAAGRRGPEARRVTGIKAFVRDRFGVVVFVAGLLLAILIAVLHWTGVYHPHPRRTPISNVTTSSTGG